MPVKQVALFSSGVGYFEHAGSVSGDGSTTLRFKSDQINDVLKSLLLEDLDGGKVGAVTYPSPAPLERTLKSFQVDITDNPPLATLLNQLRGAKITVQTMEGPQEGMILGVEKQERIVNEKQVVDQWVLNLRSGRMVQPISLDRVRNLEMEDDKLNRELDDALSALAQARDQDKKPVDIRFNGTGDRRVRIGYVVETPVWKTSYRLVLDNVKPADKDEPAPATQPAGGMLQGWAIVENQTDTDWNNVDLSLISGRPISYITDLYHSIYIPRPFIETQLYASLQPQTYQNGITGEEVQRIQQKRASLNSSQQSAQNQMQNQIQSTNSLFSNGQARQQVAAQMPAPIDPVASVAAAASAAGLGELFQYSVGNVSIKRQQSAMIPIVTDPISTQRVSIYNRNVLAAHPLNGARIRNTTRKHLLGGPVTVLDAGSYAGDAMIDDVPPGQVRFLSYGIDLKVNGDITDDPRNSSLEVAKIVRGVLQIQWKDYTQTTYVLTNHAAADRMLVIEHPRQYGWKLAIPEKADEMTAGVYRFVRSLDKDKTLKLTVVSELTREEKTELLPLDIDNLLVYTKFQSVSQPVKDSLQQIAASKRAIILTQEQIEERRKGIAEITTEQARMRENMKTVSQTTDYYTRLIKKLDEQETEIEHLQKEQADLTKQLETQRSDLDKKISQLTID